MNIDAGRMMGEFDDMDRRLAAMQSRAEAAEALVYELHNMINLLLDQVDYTSGACRVNEMVGAVLGKNLIGAARKLVKGGEG